ncbi:MAG: periplasmic protein TonB [Acidobacteriota bacterium]|jgi:hypothetical protein|nr:periplasmic protein TonB [Acidobacteriota bacterium]
MRRLVSLFVMLAAAKYACAATTLAAVAKLVLAADAGSLTEPLTAALADPQPLARATAARVIAVRDLKPLVAALREAVTRETDSSAAREEIQALALIGSSDDVAFAAAASAKLPPGVDDALAIAIARRGGQNALAVYETTLRERPISNRPEFFRIALWGEPGLIPVAASRMVATGDARGWRGMLSTLRESAVAMPPSIVAASLTSPDEQLRYGSLHYLVHSYAPDPAKLPEVLRPALAETRTEKSSDREDFARVLLARMLGGARTDDPRWTTWMESAEAGELLETDSTVLQYLTDAEYAVRHNRCNIESADCRLPEKRPAMSARLAPQAVAPPAFNLPDTLPAGLVHEIMSESKCRDEWLGVLTATIDTSGRVQKVPLDIDIRGGCRTALDEILHLSFASNTSLRSPLTGPVLVVKARGLEPCLDWEVPEKVNSARVLRAEGAVKAPIIKKRVEPRFPETARYQMRDAGGSNALLILESVISSSGCVRSLRFLAQTPLPTLNGAAALALSQWKFVPGYINGQPVDVIFNLTVNFKLN